MDDYIQPDPDVSVYKTELAPTPVTIDYAGAKEYVIQTHFTRSLCATLMLFPVGLIALFCSGMAMFKLTDGKYEQAHRWGKRAGFIGMLGLIMFVVGTFLILIV